MTERTNNIMTQIWEARNSGADTEEKLVSSIIRIVAANVIHYNAQNDLIVLDKNDMLALAQEFE